MMKPSWWRSVACGVVVIGAVAANGCGSSAPPPNPAEATAIDTSQAAVDRAAKMLDTAKNPSPGFRRLAAEELAKKGAAAKSALPALEKAAAEDPDPSVQKAAAEAVAKIKAAG